MKMIFQIQPNTELGRGNLFITERTDFVESIIDSIEEGEKTIGFFMDIFKAFDSADYNMLYNKLRASGIKGTPLNLIKSLFIRQETIHRITPVTENTNKISI